MCVIVGTSFVLFWRNDQRWWELLGGFYMYGMAIWGFVEMRLDKRKG